MTDLKKCDQCERLSEGTLDRDSWYRLERWIPERDGFATVDLCSPDCVVGYATAIAAGAREAAVFLGVL